MGAVAGTARAILPRQLAIVLAAIILICAPLRAGTRVLAMRDWRQDWFRIGKFTLCLRVRAVAVLETAFGVGVGDWGFCHLPNAVFMSGNAFFTLRRTTAFSAGVPCCEISESAARPWEALGIG